MLLSLAFSGCYGCYSELIMFLVNLMRRLKTGEFYSSSHMNGCLEIILYIFFNFFYCGGNLAESLEVYCYHIAVVRPSGHVLSAVSTQLQRSSSLREVSLLLAEWQAEWLAGECAVRPSHFMAILYEQFSPSDSRPASCQCRERNRVQCKSFTWQTGRYICSFAFIAKETRPRSRMLIKWNMSVLERRNLDCFGPMIAEFLGTLPSFHRILPAVWYIRFYLQGSR